MRERVSYSKAPGTWDYRAMLSGYYHGMRHGVSAVPDEDILEQFLSELRVLIDENVSQQSARHVA